jgi:Isocitrate lyase family
MDDLIKLATGGISSTSAMGEGVTEGMKFLIFHVNHSPICSE